MRQQIQLSAFLLLFVNSHFVRAGEVDHRFEGIWTGVETFRIPATLAQQGYPPLQKPVVIAIGESGRIMAVAQGFDFGRYEVLAESHGDTLNFKSFGRGFNGTLRFKVSFGPEFDSPAWRSSGTLRLSPDGNTLKEEGLAFVSPFLTCNVTATLHRQGKK